MGILLANLYGSRMSLLSSFVWVLLLASAFMGALGNLEGQICTDVSYWTPVVYKPVNITCCTSKVKTECVETIVEECVDVEETKCEVVGWSDCKMEDCPVTVTDPEPVYTEFTGLECTMVPVNYTYNKTLPECHNVTKEICTTLWERDANGNPVWNGKEDCKDVHWLVCHPVKNLTISRLSSQIARKSNQSNTRPAKTPPPRRHTCAQSVRLKLLLTAT